VTQADVERRPVALDEVLLEVEGLRLSARDDDFDALDPACQRVEPAARVSGAEIGANPGTQRLRLAHVQNGVVRAPEEIDPRPRGEGVELRFDALGARIRGRRHAAPSLAMPSSEEAGITTQANVVP